MGERFDQDDQEKVFNFDDGEGTKGGGEGGEGGESGSGLSAEALLKRQQEEQGDLDQHSEDRGDNHVPTDDELPAEVDKDLLGEMQGLLGEEEGGEKGEAEVGKEATDKGEAKPKAPIMIPKGRFDDVCKKMREAVARADDLEAQLAQIKPAQPATPYDFDDAEARYMAALVEEGDQEKALAIRKEIREAEKAIYRAESASTVQTTNTQAQVADAFQTVVASAIELYPFLDSEKPETRNDDAIEMVISLRLKYEAEGKSSAKALQMAVDKVAPLFSTVSADEPVLTEAQKRAQEALQRNADAARRQPPNLAKFGEQAGKATINVAELSEKDFDALPEEEKSRLRGDTV